MGLQLGQQVWGHGLGRSLRDLPSEASASLAAEMPDLEDRLRILDALYIPTCSAMPVGSLTQSLQRVGLLGSYGRGTAGVGSDLDLLLVEPTADGPQHQRLVRWPLEKLPLSCLQRGC